MTDTDPVKAMYFHRESDWLGRCETCLDIDGGAVEWPCEPYRLASLAATSVHLEARIKEALRILPDCRKHADMGTPEGTPECYIMGEPKPCFSCQIRRALAGQPLAPDWDTEDIRWTE